MGFNQKEISKLLVQCHRRCCICHRFCGVKIETDHIDPKAVSEDDSIENAIPVCLECHAEIHSYNDQHPRGRKFRPDELRAHKKQWLEICAQKPEAMLAAAWDRDVGPLEALVDELEYNSIVGLVSSSTRHGALFENSQFLRAIQEGMIASLNEELKDAILQAYACMSQANQHILADVHSTTKERLEGHHEIEAVASIKFVRPLITAAIFELNKFLRSDSK